MMTPMLTLGRNLLNNNDYSLTAWTPAQLGSALTVWLDASDFGTLSLTQNPYGALICIGDSWTAGKVWPQTTCTLLDIPFSTSNNFAVSGARVIGAGVGNGNGQIDTILAAFSGTLPATHLYSYKLGGNDIFAGFTPESIIAEEKLQIQRLITAGARRILIDNQKDFCLYVPAVRSQAATMNPKLLELAARQQVMIKELQNENSEASFVQYCSSDFLKAAALNPTAYNTTPNLPNDLTGFFTGGDADSLHMSANGYNEFGKWIAATVTKMARARVDVWRDKSGKGNHVSQSVAANCPEFIVQGSPQGTVINGLDPNSLPCLRFDGVNDFLERTSLGARTGVTAFIVAKLRNVSSGVFREGLTGEWNASGVTGPTNSWVLGGGTGSGPSDGVGAKPGGLIEIGAAAPWTQPVVRNSTAVLNEYYTLGVRHDGSVLEAWLNGTSLGTVSATGTINNLPSLNFYVGAVQLSKTGYSAPMDVCEIIVCLSSVTATTQIENYLANKWKTR